MKTKPVATIFFQSSASQPGGLNSARRKKWKYIHATTYLDDDDDNDMRVSSGIFGPVFFVHAPAVR